MAVRSWVSFTTQKIVLAVSSSQFAEVPHS